MIGEYAAHGYLTMEVFTSQWRCEAALQGTRTLVGRDMGTTATDKRRDGRHAGDTTATAAAATREMAGAGDQQQGVASAKPPARSRLTLERVLGVTSLSNAMLAVNPVTGEIAYAAGCIVVIYNLRRNKQVRYYRVEKAVACLCFSPSGQYLAIGEKGYLPAITIWDGADGTLCAELQMHKYGVACMAFSKDGNYLLSVGLVHDQHVLAWDLSKDSATGEMKGKAVGAALVEEKVLAMDYCQEGNFFVTVGEKHFKYWFLDAESRFLTTGYEINGLPEIQGRSAVMAAKEEATFTSVGCGHGSSKLKTFAITSDGTLCSFGVSCVMERLVSFEATCGNALSVTEAYVAIGGSSSVIRLFDPSTLEYKATMPFPPAFGKAHEQCESPQTELLQPEHLHRYPAAIGVRLTGSHLVALYSDRSLFIYDIADPQNTHADRSFLFHSGSIRDLKIAGRLRGVNNKGKLVYHGSDTLHARKNAKSGASIPQGTFVTCSDDNTVRFWHLDLHKPAKSSRFASENSSETGDIAECEPWKNPYSQEMLNIIYHDEPKDFEDEDAVVLGGTCCWNDLADIHTPAADPGPVNGLRALALHPNLSTILAGDKDGSLVLRALPLSETSTCEIGSYASEVHCVAFGEISSPIGSRMLVAAGGRDRLVHIHDSSKGFASIAKLDNHSGAVTAVHFTHDGKKLISCGADKNLVFSEVAADGKISRYNSVPFTGGKIFDIALTSDDETLIASSNNRLDVLSVATGKHLRSLHVGEQHRIDVCPANYCAAMSGSLSDKTIHIVDLQSGETLADGTGHGEVITGIKFTPDCRRLVSSSSDGCVFVWRLADELQTAIKSRLPRVVDVVVPPPAPPPVKPIEQAPQVSATAAPPPMMMPPPAPPVAHAKKVQPPTLKPSAVGVMSAPGPADRKAEAKTPPSQEMQSSDVVKKEEPRGWKGKVKAVPGPMGNVPMEDWMRTRESAKKTVHVHDEANELPMVEGSVAADNKGTLQPGALHVDRSKTPQWAKTFQVSAVEAPAKTSPPKPAQPARSKWSQRAGELPQPLTPDPLAATAMSDTSAEQGLLNLSIANMDVSQSALLAGSSLALEREQLDKRKKQQETAKAVAEMNSRLSKLGLIKPAKPTPARSPTGSSSARETELEADSETMSMSVAAVVAEKLQTTRPVTEVTFKKDASKAERSAVLDDIPAEMFESMELPIATLVKKQEATSSKRTVTSSIDLRVDQSMSTFTSGFSMEPPTPAPIPSEIPVDQSLGVFSAGYADSGAANSSAQRPERKAVPNAVETSQTILSRAEVGASLSEFTEGFKSETKATGGARQSLDLSAVSSSISAFTSGYAGEAPAPSLSVTQSLDLRSVSESLSNFTSGYGVQEAQRQSLAQPDVTQSLSSFTSGFSAPTQSIPLRESIRVDESLSVFVGGYKESGNAPKAVAASEAHIPVEEPPASVKKGDVLQSISDLDQQLALTTQMLTKFATIDSDAGADMEEIQELMAKLRGAVERFASKR